MLGIIEIVDVSFGENIVKNLQGEKHPPTDCLQCRENIWVEDQGESFRECLRNNDFTWHKWGRHTINGSLTSVRTMRVDMEEFSITGFAPTCDNNNISSAPIGRVWGGWGVPLPFWGSEVVFMDPWFKWKKCTYKSLLEYCTNISFCFYNGLNL